MKIAFFGTADFAVPGLTALVEAGHDITAVITQPDRKGGRGMRMRQSPVKECAAKLLPGLAPFQPDSLKSAEAEKYFSRPNFAPDLMVVIAYGKLLPKKIFSKPRFTAINIHGSLLPEYRGAAPVQRAVMDGKRVTGVTSMFLEEKLDAGDIIMSRNCVIGVDETAGELYSRLADVGALLLLDTVDAIEEDFSGVQRIRQDERSASYAPPIQKQERIIDFSKSAAEVAAKIKGLSPDYGASFTIAGFDLKAYRARAVDADFAAPVGTPAADPESGIYVKCGSGVVNITEVQEPGKKRVSAVEFLRGHRLI
ncbi:MAG: methionyl-tRNA formyltransferase [Oscillospiraceae bacterium]|nr:methionyl-tRNA formyltransferase [Oscillospiraceae bacterium]